MDARAELTAALRLDRRLRRRAAASAVEIPEGLVVRHDALFDVHYLNAVLLNAAAPGTNGDADAVSALCGRWQADLGHRHVVFDDEAAGEAAAVALGWERRRTLYMVFAGAARDLVADPRAREISEAEMQTLQLAALREEAPRIDAHSGVVARLTATQAALRNAGPARSFGAGADEDGPLQSMCTLLLDEDGAMIEEVATLASHRGRGLARAVVSAAVRAALEAGARRVVVPADADDWPQLLYASLGFQAVGRQVTLTLRARPGPHPRPGRSESEGV